MAKRKTAAAPANQIRKAWKDAQHAWVRVEDSLAKLVESDKALIQELRKAGKTATTKAKREVRTVAKDLDRKRKNALKRFDKITGLHLTLSKPTARATRAGR